MQLAAACRPRRSIGFLPCDRAPQTSTKEKRWPDSRRFSSRGGLFFAVVCAAGITAQTARAGTVPFELTDNRMIVRANVNGAGPFFMSLRVAGERFSNLPITVIDMDNIRRNIGFTRFDGIIGYDVLRFGA
jgi:hypothetical protein